MVVQRVWDSADGRTVLCVLADKPLLEITPAFAMRASVLLSLRVCLQCTTTTHGAAASAGGASVSALSRGTHRPKAVYLLDSELLPMSA